MVNESLDVFQNENVRLIQGPHVCLSLALTKSTLFPSQGPFGSHGSAPPCDLIYAHCDRRSAWGGDAQ